VGPRYVLTFLARWMRSVEVLHPRQERGGAVVVPKPETCPEEKGPRMRGGRSSSRKWGCGRLSTASWSGNAVTSCSFRWCGLVAPRRGPRRCSWRRRGPEAPGGVFLLWCKKDGPVNARAVGASYHLSCLDTGGCRPHPVWKRGGGGSCSGRGRPQEGPGEPTPRFGGTLQLRAHPLSATRRQRVSVRLPDRAERRRSAPAAGRAQGHARLRPGQGWSWPRLVLAGG
jgi:hypothetical protein